MGISYEEAVQAQTALEDALLKDPNVVSVGVIKEETDLGQKTGNHVIRVGIISTEIYRNSLIKGTSAIPSEYVLLSSTLSPKQEGKHIRILVVQEGKIQGLHLNSVTALFPSAKYVLPPCGSTIFGQTYPFTKKINYATFAVPQPVGFQLSKVPQKFSVPIGGVVTHSIKKLLDFTECRKVAPVFISTRSDMRPLTFLFSHKLSSSLFSIKAVSSSHTHRITSR